MVVTALQSPDFRTIRGVRKRHLSALGRRFTLVLQLCRQAGLVSMGHGALEGTTIRANASKHTAMRYSRMKTATPRGEDPRRERGLGSRRTGRRQKQETAGRSPIGSPATRPPGKASSRHAPRLCAAPFHRPRQSQHEGLGWIHPRPHATAEARWIVTSRCRIPAEHTHHVAHCRSLLGQAPRRTPSVLIVLVYGRRVDTGMLSAIFPSILVLRMSVKRRGSRCDLQRRAISWLRHDMKFPLYRLATLWQSALTTRETLSLTVMMLNEQRA
jgi:hypothetical protein